MTTRCQSNLNETAVRLSARFKPLRLLTIAVVALIASATLTACGHSEDEWQAKLAEIDKLQTKLGAERQAHQQTVDEYNAAKDKVQQLQQRLKRFGVDMQQLNASIAEQRKALEEYKRRAEQLEAIRKRFELLRTKLDSLVRLGLKVSVRNNRMVISMPGDVLFDSGKTKLKKDGLRILGQVALVIRSDAQLSRRNFQVAGHTDSKPLRSSIYKDNWGLSLMRAREVLSFLIKPVDEGGGGLNPLHWSASGYGDTDPIVPNTSPENMRRNRRVELVVMPNVEEMLNIQTLVK